MPEDRPIYSVIVDILRSLGASAMDYAPRVITAIVVLLVGLLLAKIVERVLRATLARVKFDALMEKTGITDSLKRIGVERGLSFLLPRGLYWVACLVFIQSAAEQVGLRNLVDGISALFRFLPNLAAAMAILLVGNSVAQFLANAVTTAARDSGMGFARSLGSALSGLILLIALIIAMAQLQIDTEILHVLTIVLVSGFSLAFGLSFGLGSKEATRNIVAGLYVRRSFRPGQIVEVGGEAGVLRSISSTQSELSTEDGVATIPNSILLETIAHRRDGNS